MSQKILVALDFSTASQTMLAKLEPLRAQTLKLTLLHVRPPAMGIAEAPKAAEEAESALEKLEEEFEAEEWKVDTRLEEGRPSTTILKVASQIDADLIVLANQGHSALSEVFLGSTAVEVLERSPRPVFLFCAAQAERQDDDSQMLWDRIIHPTDFSASALKAMDWAYERAREESLPIVLMHAVDRRYFGTAAVKRRQRQLEELGDRLDDKDGSIPVEFQVVEGQPKKMVVEAGDHYPGALFVMGSKGRGWLGDLMLGGTSRAMARRGTHHLVLVP